MLSSQAEEKKLADRQLFDATGRPARKSVVAGYVIKRLVAALEKPCDTRGDERCMVREAGSRKPGPKVGGVKSLTETAGCDIARPVV